MIQSYYDHFIKLLDQENKDLSIQYVLSLLDENQISLEELYEQLLTPALIHFDCRLEDKEICIWKEHTRTSIIRTILEATYPYIIKRKMLINPKNQKVVIVCPSEEYHEIGAIIATHFFDLAGYDARYIGANTPSNDIISAIKALTPDYIAISVTNYYNLVVTKKVIDILRQKYPELKIIIGGQAFSQEGALEHISYDYHITKMEDIFDFGKVE